MRILRFLSTLRALKRLPENYCEMMRATAELQQVLDRLSLRARLAQRDRPVDKA